MAQQEMVLANKADACVTPKLTWWKERIDPACTQKINFRMWKVLAASIKLIKQKGNR